MKKIGRLCIFVLLFSITLFGLTGCDIFGSNTLAIGSSVSSSDIYVGEVLKLYSNADDIGLEGNPTWTSSNSEVARIDENGVLEALQAGETTITLTVGEQSVSVDVTVLLRAETAKLSVTGNQTVEVGKTISLTATLSNSSSKAGFVWSSSDPSIASVDQDGVVTGVSGGLCTIIATCKDDDTISGSTLVYVEDNAKEVTAIINAIYQVNGEFDFSALSTNVINVIKNNVGSVVGVSNYATQTIRNGFATEKILMRVAIGTGVIYKREATANAGEYKYTVLTNQHVIDKSEQVKIYIQSIEKDIDATVLVSDKELDLAVVEFTYAIDITPATLGDIDTVKAGSFVVAIGHPTGYDYFSSSTFGIVSYVNRKLSDESSLFIQHDAAINSGNSGGPLFDMNGTVIGINTLKLASDDIDNMGFAVSIQTVREYLQANNLLP
ncbi:MAG: trypsin-like peptidase domain-containing protein [Bacilli bacterium]|nr:trypsin-like peptidase domain-containing protein [Bacilli bacterium]